ncbi:MAG: hypothetical protein ACFE8B_10130 [Candidatus Hermodarchaeota archaeon]
MRFIFSHVVKFDESALKDIELIYTQHICSEIQSKLIKGITKIICKFINVPELAMKGAILKALREWENRNGISVNILATMPIGKRLNAVKEIFSVSKRMIKNLVLTPIDRNETFIDISFERAFRYFLEHFSDYQR